MGQRPNRGGAGVTAHVLVPLANEADAIDTARSLDELEPGRVTLLFVIEKGKGVPDKTPVEQSESIARDTFDAFRETTSIQEIDETVAYGRDVVEKILEAATDHDVTAIVFRPRGGSRITQWLAGDRTLRIVTEADRPVVTLPPNDES